MNLALTTASVIVLLNAARKIRDIGMESLRAKVETGEQTETPSLAANQASVDRKILDELPIAERAHLRTALAKPAGRSNLIPSGGSILIQVLSYLLE
jgi:hypothetical protein